MYCIVRTHSGDLYAGYLEKSNGSDVVLSYSKKIFKWQGAVPNLQFLAKHGLSKAEACKASVTVDVVVIKDAVEIISASDKAQFDIEELPDKTACHFIFAS